MVSPFGRRSSTDTRRQVRSERRPLRPAGQPRWPSRARPASTGRGSARGAVARRGRPSGSSHGTLLAARAPRPRPPSRRSRQGLSSWAAALRSPTARRPLRAYDDITRRASGDTSRSTVPHARAYCTSQEQPGLKSIPRRTILHRLAHASRSARPRKPHWRRAVPNHQSSSSAAQPPLPLLQSNHAGGFPDHT